MLGKREPQRELFDVGNVFALALDPHTFHGQLAAVAPRLFHDADFAAFYDARQGRPSVPPSQLALLTLLHHEAGCSDQEAVARSRGSSVVADSLKEPRTWAEAPAPAQVARKVSEGLLGKRVTKRQAPAVYEALE